MAKALGVKLREALISVLPVSLIVAILYFTPLVSLTDTELIVFLVSSLVLIFGIALFNLGADLAMTPMGEHIGSLRRLFRSLQTYSAANLNGKKWIMTADF